MKMTSTVISKIAILAALVLVACNKAPSTPTAGSTKNNSQAQLPNIVFFVADDMYPHMLNYLPEGKGKNLTPALDRLAEEGVVLTNQHVVSPVCTPSRYNVLTGNYASRAQNDGFVEFTRKNNNQTVIQWESFITPNDQTLPGMLQQAGYVTGFAGKNHVVEAHQEPFDDYNADVSDPTVAARLQSNYKEVTSALKQAGFDYAASIYHNNPRWLGLKQLASHNQDWITAGGLDFIDANKDRPFFLYMATTLPHGPTGSALAWNADRRVTPQGILSTPPSVQPGPEQISARIKRARIKEKGRENLLWMDDALTAVINRLEHHGILDNTIIIFFNDHGQSAKGTLYQGGVLNPSLIWRQGGFPAGNTSDALVSNVDFAPTIMELAGVASDTVDMDGKSFAHLLTEKDSSHRETAYFELGYARGVKKGRWKYIAVRYPMNPDTISTEARQELLDAYNGPREKMGMTIVNRDPSKPFSHLSMVPGGGHAEFRSTGVKPGYYDADQLYDLQNDPGESRNLANDPAHADTLREMQLTLKGYLDTLPGEFVL